VERVDSWGSDGEEYSRTRQYGGLRRDGRGIVRETVDGGRQRSDEQVAREAARAAGRTAIILSANMRQLEF
jgi:hypothetical protein